MAVAAAASTPAAAGGAVSAGSAGTLRPYAAFHATINLPAGTFFSPVFAMMDSMSAVVRCARS